MPAIVYLVRKTVKNWVLDLRNKPQMLILIAFVVVILGLAMASGGTEATNPYDPQKVKLLLLVAALLFGGLTVYNGLSETRAFFRMADVNFLFPAPLRPAQVIVYGMLRNLGSLAFALLILAYQIGTLHFSLGMSAGRIALAFLCLFFALLLCLTTSMCLMLFCSGRPDRLKNVKAALLGLLILLFAYALLQTRAWAGQSPAEMMAALTAAPLLTWFPVVGWAAGFYVSLDTGAILPALLYGAALSVLLGAEVWGIAHTRTDYYEDVLDGASRFETVIAARRGRGANAMLSVNRKHKEKTVKSFGLRGGSGASALYYKRMLERSRGAFGIVGLSSVLEAACALFLALILHTNFMVFTIVSAYLTLLFRRVSSWEGELGRVYIYLMPDPPERKLFFALVPDLYAALVDGGIALLAGLALFRAPIAGALAGALAVASVGTLLTAGSVLTRRIFGTDSQNAMVQLVAVFFPMLLLGLALIPAIIVQEAFFAGQAQPVAAFLIIAAWDVLVSALLLVLGRGVLDVAGR